MTDSEPKGCLAALLGLFGIELREPDGPDRLVGGELPYRLRDDFLSPAEFSFYRVLLTAVASRATVCPKVNLADLFFVVRPNENQGFRNKIDRKHVDFLVCSPATMKPLCGIELDDASHARRDRQERDEFVDQVFEVAGLPLVRVPAQSAYSPNVLASMLERHLSTAATSRPTGMPVPALFATGGPPICPKCGVPMVQRMAKKGPNAGQSFFGCLNYPRCREMA